MSHWRATDSALTGYNKRYHTQPELDCSLSRRCRWDARIIAGAKSIVTNTLSGGITKTSRKRCWLTGRNFTSVDASLYPVR